MRPPLRECRRDLRVRSAGELRWRLEQLALAKRATVAEIEEAMHACRIELSRRPAHCQDAPGDAAFGHAYNFKLEGLPCEVLLLVAMEFDEDQAPRLLLSPTRTMATTRAQTRTLNRARHGGSAHRRRPSSGSRTQATDSDSRRQPTGRGSKKR